MKIQKYVQLLLTTLMAGACQSVSQLSIDYMQPAPISFPDTLRRVAVVNNANMPEDGKHSRKGESVLVRDWDMSRSINHYNGYAPLTAEALAEALAEQNYFDEVVICDSALRRQGDTLSTRPLSPEEVNKLTHDLKVDFLISLDNIHIESFATTDFIPWGGVFLGIMDVKVKPTISVYVPNRKGALVTINTQDSIFWEWTGRSEEEIRAMLSNEKEMLEAASEFAGSIPLKYLLPYWKTVQRYIYSGGSVNMRDAAVYVRKGNWQEAIRIWKQNYTNKKAKQKMYSAHNIALGYEMQDSLQAAVEWARKAQEAAHDVDGIDKTPAAKGVTHYILATVYLNELQNRLENIAQLDAQMRRTYEDFME